MREGDELEVEVGAIEMAGGLLDEIWSVDYVDGLVMMELRTAERS